MLFPVVMALLATAAVAAPPQFIFRLGSCPNINSTSSFQPSMLYDVEWKLMMHTDPGQEQRHCCRCVTLRYQADGSKFTSYRLGKKTNSTDQDETWSRFTAPSPFQGKYQYEYKDGSNQWQSVDNMSIAFYSFAPNFDYFMVYGCISRASTFADVALFMARDSAWNAHKIAEFKSYLNTTKPAGYSYDFFTVAHAC